MHTFIPVTGYTAYYEISADGEKSSEARPVVAVRFDPDFSTIPSTTTAMVLDRQGQMVPVDQVKGAWLVGVVATPTCTCGT